MSLAQFLDRGCRLVSLTGAVASFRVAKALRTNPGSRDDIGDFRWHRSEPFRWSSLQLMELGLMEPGQWF